MISRIISVTIFIITYNVVFAQSSWTKLEYYYNVGSLPPPYQYNYTITITNVGYAELKYTAGYRNTNENTFMYNFEIDKKMFRKLKKEIKKSNIMNLKISQRTNSEIPDGGYSDSFQIYNDEELVVTIPSYPDTKYNNILFKLYDAILKCVSQNIWEEIESKRIKSITN